MRRVVTSTPCSALSSDDEGSAARDVNQHFFGRWVFTYGLMVVLFVLVFVFIQ